MALNDKQLDTLAFCAFRYALGRATYIVGEVCDIVESLDLHPKTTERMITEVNHAKVRDDAAREQGRYTLMPLGMDCDRDRWLLFLDRMRSKAASEPQPTTL
jgi:hypothetical protein